MPLVCQVTLRHLRSAIASRTEVVEDELFRRDLEDDYLAPHLREGLEEGGMEHVHADGCSFKELSSLLFAKVLSNTISSLKRGKIMGGGLFVVSDFVTEAHKVLDFHLA